jgi:hypothetical protein
VINEIAEGERDKEEREGGFFRKEFVPVSRQDDFGGSFYSPEEVQGGAYGDLALEIQLGGVKGELPTVAETNVHRLACGNEVSSRFSPALGPVDLERRGVVGGPLVLMVEG